jgi:hypothetical protein
LKKGEKDKQPIKGTWERMAETQPANRDAGRSDQWNSDLAMSNMGREVAVTMAARQLAQTKTDRQSEKRSV